MMDEEQLRTTVTFKTGAALPQPLTTSEYLRFHLSLLGYYPVDRKDWNGPMIAQHGGPAYGLYNTGAVEIYAAGHTFAEGRNWPQHRDLACLARKVGLWK